MRLKAIIRRAIARALHGTELAVIPGHMERKREIERRRRNHQSIRHIQAEHTAAVHRALLVGGEPR